MPNGPENFKQLFDDYGITDIPDEILPGDIVESGGNFVSFRADPKTGETVAYMTGRVLDTPNPQREADLALLMLTHPPILPPLNGAPVVKPGV